VAHLTPVVEGLAGKLSAVGVGMALSTSQFPRLVTGIRARRLVALLALKRRMHPFQGKRGVPVGFAVEKRRLEIYRTVAR
jgi:hypothetical protein